MSSYYISSISSLRRFAYSLGLVRTELISFSKAISNGAIGGVENFMFVAMRVASNFLGPKSRWEAHCERIIFDWVEEGDDLIQVHIPFYFIICFSHGYILYII